MDLRELRYFAYVADSGSFTKAALNLHVGQPALSRCVQQLEKELGVTLLNRSRRGLELTPAGRMLRQRAKGILDQIGQLQHDVRAQADEVTGTAVFGVPPSAGQIVVPATMRHLGRHHPGVRLHIVEGLGAETYERLLGQTVQLGLMYDPMAHRDLFSEELAIESMCLVGRRDMLDAIGPMGGLDDLEHIPLVLPKSPNSRRLMVEKAFRDRGLMLNIVAEIDGFATTHAVLEDGIGFSIMTRGALAGVHSDHSLSAIELETVGLKWRLSLVRHASQARNQVLQVVTDAVRSVVADAILTGRWLGSSLAAGLGKTGLGKI